MQRQKFKNKKDKQNGKQIGNMTVKFCIKDY